MRLRDFEAKEHKKLSDFQGEMVQLAACLSGDHKKHTYPHKLVEGLNVAQASKYCNDAFNIFLKECEKAKKNGVDEDTVIVVEDTEEDTSSNHIYGKSFIHKFFSCLTCRN